jgi:hypothetical protein
MAFHDRLTGRKLEERTGVGQSITPIVLGVANVSPAKVALHEVSYMAAIDQSVFWDEIGKTASFWRHWPAYSSGIDSDSHPTSNSAV